MKSQSLQHIPVNGVLSEKLAFLYQVSFFNHPTLATRIPSVLFFIALNGENKTKKA